MDWGKVIVAGVALVIGVGVGFALPGGDATSDDPTASDEPAASPSPATVPPSTPQPARSPDAAVAESCMVALSVADESVRFLPEALSRLRTAYERAAQDDGETQSGPPPGATFSQLQAQAESMASEFLRSRSACESAAR